MNFDPEIALNYAAGIARPRRVGTEIDEEIAAEIADRLRGFGYTVERQLFTFSTASEAFLKVFLLAGLLLITALLIWHERALAVMLLLLVVSFMPLNRRIQAAALQRDGRGLKWGQPLATANLIAQLALPAESAGRSSFEPGIASSLENASRTDGLPHLFLVAHYDSKSQRLPLAARITLFMLAIIAGLILVTLTLLNISTALYLPIGLLALAAAVPLLFLDVGNNSPGAIDNASSVGLVLHLAEVLAQREDWKGRLGLTILLPSAEELTLMGSVAYVTAHEKLLRSQDRNGELYVLNFDGVGIDGDLYYVGRSHPSRHGDRISLLACVQRACIELKLPLKHFRFMGALFDHIPFAQRGFDAISLIAVGPASRSVHTPADSIDKLHVRGFDRAGRVALRVIEYLSHGSEGIPVPVPESRPGDASIMEYIK